MIEKHGYWRRKEELEDAEAAARAVQDSPCIGNTFRIAATSRADPGEETSNRPVGGEIVDVIDEAARGEQRDDLRRRLPGGLFV